ncbi:MAG: hypothetical protein IJ451_06655 [Ruminococcus sp.]|nr:hypothetical protein [Ruminococcus sp.]
MKKITLLIASLFITIGAMAQTATYKVSMSTGTLTNKQSGTAGNWNYLWSFTTTGENPASLKLTVSSGANNMAPDGDNLKLFGGSANSSTYVLSVPKGYMIESYSFDYVTSGTNAATLTPEGGASTQSSASTQTLTVNDINSRFVSFVISGGNYGIVASNFVVNVKAFTTEEIASPTEDGVYWVYWKQNSRGYLAYHDSYPTKGVLADVTLGNYGSSHFNSSTDPVELEWYLVTSENNNKYLFNVSNGKFLTYSEESADAAKAAYLDAARPCPITIAQNTSHTDYAIIKATVDGTEKLLSSGCGTASKTGYPIRWNALSDMADGGSPLIFVKVNDFPVDEAILAQAQAAINDYENPVEDDVTFQWTTSTPWTAAEELTSTVLNDNALANGIKYIEGAVTVAGARTATVTFAFTTGNHKLNVRGVEVIDAEGNIVAGDYAAKSTGTGTTAVYTVGVAEGGTYKVRCYATDGNGDSFTESNGTITVSFAKLDVMNLTKAVTFAAEYATLHLGYKVSIPAGVEAYVVSATNDNWATLEQVNNVIPAATPVILKNVGDGTSYNFYYTSDEAPEIESNLLEGSIVDCYVADDAYVLGIKDEEVGLYTATKNQLSNTAFKNNANKAYLPKTTGMNAASYSFRFGEGTTGISEVKGESGNVKGIYDLTGRRVENISAPGIYIVNGKKVLVK